MATRTQSARRMPHRLVVDKRELFSRLGYEPHPGQTLVHESTASRRVLVCGARWGKSICASWEAIAAVLHPCEMSVGWLVAPTYDLSDRLFQTVFRVIKERLPHRLHSFVPREHRLVVRNLGGGLSELRSRSSDNPTSLLGESLTWVIVDEAARMRHDVWPSFIAPRLIDQDGWALICSTPQGRNWFYHLHKFGIDGAAGFECWQQPSWANPHLDPA